MSSSTHELVWDPERVTQLKARTAFVLAVTTLVAVFLTLVRPSAGPGGVPPGDVRPPAATVQQEVDRRCLTRNADNCLEEPVPADEPHGAVCATCHNLWEDRDNPEKVRACTDADCHSDPLDLSPFHTTLEPRMLQDCSHCHPAHGFRASPDGRSCSDCHAGAGDRVVWAGGHLLQDVPVPETPFVHENHLGVACETCHGVGYAHATLRVRSVEDCRSCHHGAPARSPCVECHDQDSVNALEIHVVRELAIDIGSVERPVRWLRFGHEAHTGTPCVACHTEGMELATGPGADCSTCHAQHHEPTADCSACHARPAGDAHDASAHLGCGGDGCHTAPAGIRDALRTRPLCLACHRDRADHHVGQRCSACHILPEPARHSAQAR